jgi:PhzF family phenazine biosynthesis protein
MTDRRIHYVDVFTATPLLGNPVAVVLDGDGLTSDTMQAVARWTNLSETTFVVPTDRADYGLRIFTPVSELPFAGHPTVGSAHAVLEAGLATGPTVIQDCAAGLVPIDQDDDGRIRAITPRTDATDRPVDGARVAAALGIDPNDLADPVVIDAGPFWLVARLPTSAVVDDLRPDLAAIAALSRDDPTLTGITVYGHDDGERVTVRSFAPAAAVDEDPVCGSGNAAVGRHRALTESRSTGYTAHQGAALHRDGRVAVDYEGDQVTIGGHAVTTVRGTLHEL